MDTDFVTVFWRKVVFGTVNAKKGSYRVIGNTLWGAQLLSRGGWTISFFFFFDSLVIGDTLFHHKDVHLCVRHSVLRMGMPSIRLIISQYAESLRYSILDVRARIRADGVSDHQFRVGRIRIKVAAILLLQATKVQQSYKTTKYLAIGNDDHTIERTTYQ